MTNIDMTKLNKIQEIVDKQPEQLIGIWSDGESELYVAISEFIPKIYSDIAEDIVDILNLDYENLSGGICRDIDRYEGSGGYFIKRRKRD